MLDAISFEKRGIPAAAIITEPFMPTAEAIAVMSGLPGYRVAVIPHPVGSLNHAEVMARGEAVASRVLDLLLRCL